MQRLGKNHGGYHGETIDIRTVLRKIESAARESGWASEAFLATAEFKWPALHRRVSPQIPAKRRRAVYVSSGIHGDEPAGPLAVLHLLRENRWPENVELWICPCLNPRGFELNRRENPEGLDLNRQYRNSQALEVIPHIAWLERQPKFDLCLLLHEDWESHGFYLYEQNPDPRPSLAEAMIEQVAKVCPIDPSEIIEDRPANNGIIRPIVKVGDRPDWPEAFYVITHKTRLSYTLEAPSDFPMNVRVAGLVAAVSEAVRLASESG